MMNRALAATLLATIAAARPLIAQQRPSSSEIDRTLRAHADRVRWPGFDALAIPLAIFDGTTTTLFRHPAPPAGFFPIAGSAGFGMTGRHPSVSANSSADIGGQSTATLMNDAPGAATTADELAAVALHESFHVYQRRRHPTWQGNEGDVFLYPIDDARRLALRRLETEALHHALDESTPRQAVCWARGFIALRTSRYDGLDSAFVKYERLTELNEGLAAYVQLLAAGRATVPIPAGEFAASALRLRTYTTGPAIALLLDRFAPQWKNELEANDKQSLDEMLAAALLPQPPSAPCAPDEERREAARRTAAADSAAIAGTRTARRAAFDHRQGWRLIVQPAEGEPLWPQGFDPLNVERVDGGLLHTRYLKLGNAAGTIEIIDESGSDVDALTVSAGAHPLFNGVRELRVAGFAEPAIGEDAGTLSIQANGVHLTLRHATLRREDTTLVVTLTAAK